MGKLKRKDYEAALDPMLHELVGLARWLRRTGARMVVIFEGRDTAGKGGVIGAIEGHINPRQCRVVALGTPTEREKGEWYFQRYIRHLPTAGEIVLFDRSWYNRAGVEKVMGFATPDQVEAFLAAAPAFEQQLVDAGILLFKYWLCCDQDKQEERFAERAEDPLKSWKLSPIDLTARELFDEYTQARETMLRATHTEHAPWTLVDFNDQKLGRLTLIRDLLDRAPDMHVEEREVLLPPLKGKPSREKYSVIKPIPEYDL